MVRLRELRIEKQISQQELAHKIGVTTRYIGFLEAGKRNPSIEIANKISNVLGSSIEKIFLDSKCTKST